MQPSKMLLKSVLLLGAVAVIVKPLSATGDDLPSSLVVTSILDAPFLSQRQSNDGLQYEGYCADLAAELASRVGFNYTIKLVADGKYGQKSPDGTWTGMIGEVIRGDADLAVAPLTITSARESVVEFSKPFMNLGISIMIKKPPKADPGVYFFLAPFSGELWLALLITCPAVGLALFVLARYGKADKQQQSSDAPTSAGADDDGNQFNFSNSLWYSLRTMVHQGTNTDPRSISGRVLIATWWLFVVFITALYTASLIAIVYGKSHHGKMLVPVGSVDDLAQQTVIEYGLIEGGSTKEFFKSSTEPIYQKMWARMSSAQPSVFVKSTLEGVTRVRESHGRYAFLMESTVNNYVSLRKPCDTMRVGQLLNSRGYGIAMKAGSALRSRINVALLQMSESGFLARLEKKWWFDGGECSLDHKLASDDKQDTAFSGYYVSIRDVAGLFYLLIFGIVLSFVIGLLEYVYARRKSSNTRKATEAQPDEKAERKSDQIDTNV